MRVSNAPGSSSSSTASSSPGIVGVDTSAGSTYEVTSSADVGGSGFLQLKRVKDFPTSRTIAAASPEFGWTWLNRTTPLTSATDNTTNANESTWTFSSTSTTWYGATRDSPVRYRSIDLPAGHALDIVCRVRSTAQRDFELAGIMVFDIGTTSNWSRVMVGYDSGLVVNSSDTSGASTPAPTVTGTQVNTNGVWLRMVWSAEGWVSFYSTANQSTPPTSWTMLKRTVTASGWGPNTLSSAIGVGMSAYPQNTSGDFVVRWKYWQVNILAPSQYPTGMEWGTELFSTSGTEQLVGEMDFGTAVALSQAQLRSILTSATNTRPIDSATVTYSVVGGSSTGPASGSYAAAGSVTVSGSYRYWRVYAKITSATGVEQGSVKLPIFLPVAP